METPPFRNLPAETPVPGRYHSRLTELERVARIGFWEYDVATGQHDWSDGMFALLGFDPALGIPCDDAVMRRCHPDDILPHDTAILRALLDGEPYAVDLRLVFDDAAVRWLHARGEGIEDACGQVVRLFGTLMDVTERKEAELAREAALAALETSRQQRRSEKLRVIWALALRVSSTDSILRSS